MSRIIGILRLILWVLWTLLFFLLVLFFRITFLLSYKFGLKLRKYWAKGFVIIYGIDAEWGGKIPRGQTCLYVCNHRSSIDPFIQLARLEADPVSRADLGNWPLIGHGARMTGIILVDKSSPESRKKAKTAILDALNSGRSVLIYPEGGTKTEPQTSTFQIGSFLQAAEAGVPVVPMVIEYKYKEDYWDHTDSSIVHLIKRFGKWRSPVYVGFGPPIEADNGWTLMRQARAWIDDAVIDARRQWDGPPGSFQEEE